MHRVRAIVKAFKADPVCQALLGVGVDEVYVEEVQGYGRQKGHLGLYRQQTYGIAFLPKIAITAYVTDDLVEPACKAIEETAITGTIGDGKIFVTPVDYAIPHSLESRFRPSDEKKVAAAQPKAKKSKAAKPAPRKKPVGKSRRAPRGKKNG